MSVVPRTPASSPSPAEWAISAGRAARRLYDEWTDAEIDEFALKLAAEKESKKQQLNVPSTSSVSGRNGGGRSGGRGRGGKNCPVNKSDLRTKAFRLTSVPSSVPRAGSSTYWVVEKQLLGQISTSITTLVEQNYSFQVSQLNSSASYLAVFDQYHIAQVSLTFSSLQAPNSAGVLADFHTALDLDNQTNLGSIAAIDSYSSSQVDNLSYGKSVTRSVRPCIKTTSGSSAASVCERQWVDSAFNAIAHYGIRSIVNTTVGAAYAIRVEQTMWVCFRSNL